MLVRNISTILISCVLIACSKAPFLYTPEITQGNVFTKEQIEQIYVGMPRDQVRHILGTPTLNDPFHPELDVYAFSFKSSHKNRTYRRSMKIIYDAQNRVVDKQDAPMTINGK